MAEYTICNSIVELLFWNVSFSNLELIVFYLVLKYCTVTEDLCCTLTKTMHVLIYGIFIFE